MSHQSMNDRRMPPTLNAQGYYDLGYAAGQQFYAHEPEHKQAELYKIAQQQAVHQGLPMVMQAQFKDGFIAGYGPAKQEGDTAQKRQS